MPRSLARCQGEGEAVQGTEHLLGIGKPFAKEAASVRTDGVESPKGPVAQPKDGDRLPVKPVAATLPQGDLLDGPQVDPPPLRKPSDHLRSSDRVISLTSRNWPGSIAWFPSSHGSR